MSKEYYTEREIEVLIWLEKEITKSMSHEKAINRWCEMINKVIGAKNKKIEKLECKLSKNEHFNSLVEKSVVNYNKYIDKVNDSNEKKYNLGDFIGTKYFIWRDMEYNIDYPKKPVFPTMSDPVNIDNLFNKKSPVTDEVEVIKEYFNKVISAKNERINKLEAEIHNLKFIAEINHQQFVDSNKEVNNKLPTMEEKIAESFSRPTVDELIKSATERVDDLSKITESTLENEGKLSVNQVEDAMKHMFPNIKFVNLTTNESINDFFNANKTTKTTIGTSNGEYETLIIIKDGVKLFSATIPDINDNCLKPEESNGDLSNRDLQDTINSMAHNADKAECARYLSDLMEEQKKRFNIK